MGQLVMKLHPINKSVVKLFNKLEDPIEEPHQRSFSTGSLSFVYV